MLHSVRLERWPENIRIPEDLQNRLRYDAATHRVAFDGFMSKIDFDRLLQASSDWGYKRALEELFRLCVPEESGPPKKRFHLPFFKHAVESN